MLRILLVFVFIFLSSPGFSKGIKYIGEGRFYAKDEDTPTFIKNQLFYNSVKDIITKQLKRLNFKIEDFWTQYEEAFDESFLKEEERLKTKYKEGQEGQTAKQKEAYTKFRRKNRLRMKSKFGDLKRILLSYRTKKRSRSQQYPKSRFLSLEATIDPSVVYKIYYEFYQGESSQKIKNFYYSVQLELENGDWDNLGISSKSELETPLIEKWIQASIEELKFNMEKGLMASSSDVRRFQQMLMMKDQDVEETVSSEEDLRQSLWFHLNARFKVLEKSQLMNSSKFQVTGDIVVFDLRNRKIIDSFDIPITMRKYTAEKESRAASELGTFIYREGLKVLRGVSQGMKSLPIRTQRQQLQIHNIEKLTDLYDIAKLINGKGVHIGANASLSSRSRGKGTLLLEYRGSKAQVAELMDTLRNSSVGDSKIRFPYHDNPFYLLLSKTSEAKSGI